MPTRWPATIAADREIVAARVAEIAAILDPDDGVEVLAQTVTTSPIRDDALYAGVRVVMTARIATAQVKLRIDINFGDPVTPEPRLIELPALRPDTAPVRVLGYPVETVLAEKLATAIALGAASTRVRDWADVYVLIVSQPVSHGAVREALQATAAFRGTALLPLSAAIGALVSLRGRAYAAYRSGLGPDSDHLPEDFEHVVAAVVAFADPLIDGADPAEQWNPVACRWEKPRHDSTSTTS